MRALRSLLAASLALLPLACGGETPTSAPTVLAPTTAVPASALPRVGSIADPPADAFAVAIAADGTLFAGPREVDLDGLAGAIRAAVEAFPERKGDGAWARDVHLRVHASVPWQVVSWVMRILAAPRVKAYRLHFAVLPEEGDREGTLAVWLPRDTGGLSYRVHALGVTAEAASTTVSAGRAYAEIRRSLERLEEPRGVALKVGPGFATGNVLKVVDWAVRAGAALVQFANWPPPPPEATGKGSDGRTALQEWVASHPVREAGMALTVSATRIAGDSSSSEAPDPPPVVRVARATEAPTGGVLGPPEDPSETGRASPAVEAALQWLAAHQSPEGPWEAEGFNRWCRRTEIAAGTGPDGAGKAQYDVGVTGLALLAFLGAGYTNRSEGPYGKVVGDGIRYLKNVQDKEGCFGERKYGHYVYNHAVATIAMVEAFRATGSAIYVNPAKRAVEFVLLARNRHGTWRYGIQPGDDDTSITGWMTLALWSAERANAEHAAAGRAPALPSLDEDVRDAVLSWLNRMTDGSTGRVGYQHTGQGPARPAEMVERFPEENSEATTATATLLRSLLLSPGEETALLEKGADIVSRVPPRWDLAAGFIDMDYWLMGTLALRRLGGGRWEAWSEEARSAILGTQRKDGDPCGVKGSWDPVDPWGPDGGRVYSTAMLCLCCEVLAGSERVITAPSR